jgi:predicted nucleic acid-binding protein
MNEASNFERIDKEMKKVVKNLSKDMLIEYKEFMEDEFFFGAYGRELELNVVIDASTILAEAHAYLKYGKSYLFDLMKSPFLKVFSPPWLKTELDKKIPEFSKKMKINEEQFRVAVERLSKEVQIIKDATENSNNTLLKKIRERDAKDLPYVILYIEKKFNGILTKDRDISDYESITTWSRPGEVGKIIQIFENGAFAYAVIGELPTIFALMAELCNIIIKGAWEVISAVAALLVEAAAGAVDVILRLPDWMKVAALIGTILLLAWDKSRTFIIEGVKTISKWLIDFLKWIYEGIKSILNAVGGAVVGGAAVIEALFIEVERTISYYEQINHGG